MGIHGLTGFIDNNQHVLHEHQLHDCSVVLDGNNFFHFLYHACHVRCGFGGDYDIYRKKIISTFESFKICGVTPYVVMDGAYTVDGRKLRTSLSRASARIKLVDVMANHQRGQAMPALAYETFMQTLTELGICHITCQFEADNEIAVLANKLRCPVISNDSDFYIFDLSNGFLPLDYLDFRPLENLSLDAPPPFHFLHCQKYFVDDFIDSFDGLNRSVLPVFASLLGNDFINPSAFTTFYSQVKVPKVISKKFSLPPRLSKVISVLHWLQSQNDGTEFADIKREILAFIKPRRQQIVERMFVTSVNGYVDVENFQGFDLFNFATVGPGQCRLTTAEDFRSYNGKAFPDWFLKAVCCGDITPSILNCAILHRVIILTQVEDLKQASAYVCSLNLRRLLYGILFQDQCTSTISNQHNELADTDTISGKRLNEGVDLRDQEKLFGEKMGLLEKLISDAQTSEGENISNVNNNEDICEVLQDNLIDGDEGVNLSAVKLSGVKAELDESSEGHTSHEKDVIAEENAEDVCEVKDDNLADDDGENVKVCEDVNESGVSTGSGQKRVKDSCVEEYTRMGKNLLKSIVQPLFNIGDVFVPGLASLGAMSLEDRRYIMAESLGVDEAFMGRFSGDLQLFAACIVMWARNASPRITLGHLESVIAGVIVVRTLSSLAGRKADVKGDGVKIESSGDGVKAESSGEGVTAESSGDGVKAESSGDGVKAESSGDGVKAESSGDGVKIESRGDGVKIESRGDGVKIESSGDGVKAESSGEGVKIESRGDGVKTESRGDLKTKTDDEPNTKSEPTVKGVGDLRGSNVEPTKGHSSCTMENKDELEDINEVRKASKVVADDFLTNLPETIEQAEDSSKENPYSLPINISLICSETAVRDLENARQNLSKYHAKGPTFNNNNHFNPTVCHAFAQLQACMVDAINLNKLLRVPLPNIQPSQLINGTFLYNFYLDISTRANTDLFLATMLGRKSSLFSTLQQFRNSVVDFVGVDNFVSQSSSSKKSRKRKSKGKEKGVASDGIKMEKSEEKDLSVKTVSGFNVANMFSVLSMED